jgi:hypothetical protein
LCPHLYIFEEFSLDVSTGELTSVGKRFQPIEQRWLTCAIIDRAQHSVLGRACPPFGMGVGARQRLIGILFQLSLQPAQLQIQLRFERFQALPIYTPNYPGSL